MPFNQGCQPIKAFSAEFYTLEALKLFSQDLDPFKKSNERFIKDLSYYKHRYEVAFSIPMLDYLSLACAGEARNAEEHCSKLLVDLPKGGPRYVAFDVAEHFTWQSICKATQVLFTEGEWGGGYGGHMWANIAKGALLYEKMPLTSWLDHCIDLSHNGGCAFNKSDFSIFYLDDEDEYKRFLDRKSSIETPSDLLEVVVDLRLSRLVSQYAVDFLQRASVFGMVDQYIASEFKSELPFISNILDKYNPVKWGTKEVSLTMENTNKCNDCCCYCCENYNCSENMECEGGDCGECEQFNCPHNTYNDDEPISIDSSVFSPTYLEEKKKYEESSVLSEVSLQITNSMKGVWNKNVRLEKQIEKGQEEGQEELAS